MKQPAILLSILCAVIIGSCSSFEIPAEKNDYIGTWTGPSVFLQITPEAKLNYKKQEGSSTTSLNVPITSFEGDNFTAGVMGMETTFVVSQPPTLENNGMVFMVVDGNKLFRE